MKRISLVSFIIIMCLSLAACAKRVNGQKVYKTQIENGIKPTAGTGKCNRELIRIKGTTSAPSGYQVVAISNTGQHCRVGEDTTMQNNVKVKDSKFAGYIDPAKNNPKVKKGDKLKYHFLAVKNPKDIKDNKSTKNAINKKFNTTTVKINFEPTTLFVQSKVQARLGSGAKVSKKSKTVYTITPKKDSSFENDVSKAMYDDKDSWNSITKRINQLSKQIKTPNGRIALVLMNPENHKKFLFVSIGGKTKYDAITSGTVNSNASNAKNVSSHSDSNDDDGDDFELAMILAWLLAYDEEYGDDSSEDTNDDYYDDSDTDNDYYDYDNDYDNNDSQDNQDSSDNTNNNNGQQQNGGQENSEQNTNSANVQ
ncbi:MAG TPA: hypothetical protein K8W06_00105 [Limosilactobacillus coleohominis]|nr:hypothetical protein [Limosilactobacillus coleohominis]